MIANQSRDKDISLTQLSEPEARALRVALIAGMREGSLKPWEKAVVEAAVVALAEAIHGKRCEMSWTRQVAATKAE